MAGPEPSAFQLTCLPKKAGGKVASIELETKPADRILGMSFVLGPSKQLQLNLESRKASESAPQVAAPTLEVTRGDGPAKDVVRIDSKGGYLVSMGRSLQLVDSDSVSIELRRIENAKAEGGVAEDSYELVELASGTEELIPAVVSDEIKTGHWTCTSRAPNAPREPGE